MQHLTSQGVSPALMESFNIIMPDTPDRPEDRDLLWNIPANDKANQQRHFVYRAINMMNFTVNLMELQISLLRRPDEQVSEDIKKIIRRCIHEDGDKFLQLQKEIHEVLDVQSKDGLQLRRNRLNADDVHKQKAAAENAFTEIFDHDNAIAITGNADDVNYSHLALKPQIARAKIPTLLSKIFDVRMHLLDQSIDILEFKMHSALSDMARYMQWDVLRQVSPNLNSAHTKREMEKAWETAKACHPELKAGVDTMYKYFREIVRTDDSSGEFQPILNRYVVAPASDLPQITP